MTRGYLGVTIQNVTPEIGESLGISAKDGALVNDVVDGGPASKAGVMAGDVIMSVNGKKVTSASDLTRQVALAKAGDRLRIEVLRSGRHMTLQIVSGVRPSEAQLSSNTNDDDGSQGGQAEPQVHQGDRVA